jgi:6-phosphogluconolactonase
VPPASEQSNYRMARETLIDHVAIPAENVHRIRGEDDPAQAALRYEQVLRELFNSATAGRPGDGAPRIDLILLGIGEEGHVASLFPGSEALHERTRWALAQEVPVDPRWRVTLTPAIINAAREVAFLVAGAAKAEIVRRVIEGPAQPDLLPAQVVAPADGRLTWFLDAAAAAQLNGVREP